jgi:hypothetical protein
MSHPLCDYARYVERVLCEDEALERPTYAWCVEQVTARMDAAAATISPGLIGKPRRAALSKALVTLIKSEAPGVRR